MGLGYRINAKSGKRAEILIYEDVGDSWFGGVSAKQFAGDIKALGGVDTIDVRINSYGGDVFDGLAIYRQLADHDAHIAVHIDGVAASIASVIAMAGDEINIAAPGFMMVHNAWGVALGASDVMRSVADRLDAISGALVDVYVARTGRKTDEVKAWMDAETWFTSAEALDAGLVTSVVENAERMAASFDPKVHRFANMPADLVGPRPPEPSPIRDGAVEALTRMRARLNVAQHRAAIGRS